VGDMQAIKSPVGSFMRIPLVKGMLVGHTLQCACLNLLGSF